MDAILYNHKVHHPLNKYKQQYIERLLFCSIGKSYKNDQITRYQFHSHVTFLVHHTTPYAWDLIWKWPKRGKNDLSTLVQNDHCYLKCKNLIMQIINTRPKCMHFSREMVRHFNHLLEEKNLGFMIDTLLCFPHKT